MDIDLQITNTGRYPVNQERLFGVIQKTLNTLVGDRNSETIRYEISLLIVDKVEMAAYNLKYHETAGPTDVLSFPYTDPASQISDVNFVTHPDAGIILGDLIVCYPIAEEEAVKQGKPPQEMVEFYVDHGLQHLLGHHHD